MDYKVILWIITVIIWIYAYYPYISDIFKGKTKPHLFSWIIFLIMDTIAFLIQIGDNAGPWSWWTLTTGLLGLIVLVLAFKRGEKHITTSDCIAFALALLCIVFYVLLPDPTYSLYLVLCISALALYPTARKSFYKPSEETLSIYVIAGIRSILSILATVNISLLTIWLPAFLIIINSAFVLMVLVRKKQLWIN